jgi:NAD(P) transhydrogenase
MSGVGLGTLATLGSLHTPMPVMAGIMALLASGAYAGTRIAHKVGPTELPQTVAAFHSLVGVAALGTALGDAAMYLGNPEVRAVNGHAWMCGCVDWMCGCVDVDAAG